MVSRESNNRREMEATSSTAAWKEASLAFDGLLNPEIFLTNCSDAARTSSSVTGGSKLKSVLIFLHIRINYRPGYFRPMGEDDVPPLLLFLPQRLGRQYPGCPSRRKVTSRDGCERQQQGSQEHS